jgi:hypothetical protein
MNGRPVVRAGAEARREAAVPDSGASRFDPDSSSADAVVRACPDIFAGSRRSRCIDTNFVDHRRSVVQ